MFCTLQVQVCIRISQPNKVAESDREHFKGVRRTEELRRAMAIGLETH